MAHVTGSVSARAHHSGVAEIFGDLRRRYSQYRTYHKTLSEMRQLSDRELADLGLHRSMLKRLALQAVYGE